ncbi:MAG: NINE protein [Sulfitobacter sp.]
MTNQAERSPKSYGIAVCLCGVFGTMGIHHFYLEDWWHGLADLALFILTITFFMQGLVWLAFITLMMDAIHTVIIFYYLIIEKWRDGQGRPVLL